MKGRIRDIHDPLAVLLLYFRHSIPARYDVNQLKQPNEAIHDLTTFRTGWAVLVLLLVGFFGLEPLGVPIIQCE